MNQHIVHLLLGANIGDTVSMLRRARIYISMCIGQIQSTSPVYDTSPWGFKDQEPFVNQAISCQTDLNPRQILRKIHWIENRLGKKKIAHWGPRSIDIDILLYESQIIQDDDLKVPHPHMSSRRFVLIPLTQIASELIHPVKGITIKEMLELCKDTGSVKELGKD